MQMFLVVSSAAIAFALMVIGIVAMKRSWAPRRGWEGVNGRAFGAMVLTIGVSVLADSVRISGLIASADLPLFFGANGLRVAVVIAAIYAIKKRRLGR
jgi:hypothetical protein